MMGEYISMQCSALRCKEPPSPHFIVHNPKQASHLFRYLQQNDPSNIILPSFFVAVPKQVLGRPGWCLKSFSISPVPLEVTDKPPLDRKSTLKCGAVEQAAG